LILAGLVRHRELAIAGLSPVCAKASSEHARAVFREGLCQGNADTNIISQQLGELNYAPRPFGDWHVVCSRCVRFDQLFCWQPSHLKRGIAMTRTFTREQGKKHQPAFRQSDDFLNPALNAKTGGEVLVPDERMGIRPAQQVELKLMAILKDRVVPVSHMRVTRLIARRHRQ
jgi:hypothetical protein